MSFSDLKALYTCHTHFHYNERPKYKTDLAEFTLSASVIMELATCDYKGNLKQSDSVPAWCQILLSNDS